MTTIRKYLWLIANLLVVAGAITGVVVMFSNDLAEQQRLRNLKYQLAVGVPYGPVMATTDTMLITHLQRNNDGSICFDQFRTDKHYCIRVQNYYLLQVSVE